MSRRAAAVGAPAPRSAAVRVERTPTTTGPSHAIPGFRTVKEVVVGGATSHAIADFRTEETVGWGFLFGGGGGAPETQEVEEEMAGTAKKVAANVRAYRKAEAALDKATTAFEAGESYASDSLSRAWTAFTEAGEKLGEVDGTSDEEAEAKCQAAEEKDTNAFRESKGDGARQKKTKRAIAVQLAKCKDEAENASTLTDTLRELRANVPTNLTQKGKAIESAVAQHKQRLNEVCSSRGLLVRPM